MITNFFLGLILSLIFSLNDAQLNSVRNSQLDSYPEQIHLSYGLPDQMIGKSNYSTEVKIFKFLKFFLYLTVTWVTLDYVNESIVEYGINDFKNVVTGVSEIFIDGGSEKRKINIHRVILNDLKPDQTYSKRFKLNFKEFQLNI